MTECKKKTISSNLVGLSYADESCIGKLPDAQPDTGLQDGAVWRQLHPETYSDFGATVTTTERNPINPSRQRRKNLVTGLTSSGGFSSEFSQNNLKRLMQGFFFADARERVSNDPINGKDTNSALILNIVAAGSEVVLEAGKGVLYAAGNLVKLSGFVNAGNNADVAKVESVVGDDVSLDIAGMTNEVYTVGKMELVGYEFAAGDLQLVFADNALTLTSAVGFADKNFNVGEWIFIGDDDTDNSFLVGGMGENKPGYARITSVTANSLSLAEPTFTPLSDTGAGKTVRLYAGTYIRNEKDPSLIKTRSYQLERTLGSDADGVQSEVLVGAVSNEMSLNVGTADKVMCDLGFVALKNDLRSGQEGQKLGSRTTLPIVENPYNTAHHVYQQRLYIHGDTPTPLSLFTFVTSSSLTVNNNATVQNAVGVFGGFDVNIGDFMVTGSVEVYFASVAAAQAVKDNADVGFNRIIAAYNTGVVYDIPLLSLGGGTMNVQKDTTIMLPLEKQAAENQWGYTMSATYFSYLPNVAQAEE